METGKYIVIEGNDGTGKSTQIDMLAEYLISRGIETVTQHEPAGTPMADAIRTIIKNGELERSAETNLLLFTAARTEIWQRAKTQLALGKWVLSARNYLSTIAYQGSGQGLDTDKIISITRDFTDERYMQPDRTIILTLDDESRKIRIAKRGELDAPDTFESMGDDFQTKVNSTYMDLASKYNYPVVDATQTIDEVQMQIRKLIGLVDS